MVERVHGLIQPQALHIGPFEHREEGIHARHFIGTIGRLEGDILRAAQGLDALDEIRQREPDPGDDHRPALDAAHAVDALLEGRGLDEILDRELARLSDHPVDLHRPGRGLEGLGLCGRIVLAGAELVIIVVAGDVLPARLLLVRGERALGGIQGRGAQALRQRRRCQRQTGGARHPLAAVEIDLPGRDLGGQDIGRAADQHGITSFETHCEWVHPRTPEVLSRFRYKLT